MSVYTDLSEAWSNWQQSSLYRKWKISNPGESAKLDTYRSGGVRPSLVTQTGKALVFETDAWLASAPVDPPPPPPPPPTSGLRWPPPAGFEQFPPVTVTNANRGTVLKRQGNVLVRQTEKLTGGGPTQVPVEQAGWVVWQGGEIDMSVASSTAIVPRDITGGLHLEGIHFHGAGLGDCVSARWVVPVVQLQHCLFDVTHQVGGIHADAFQTQEAIMDELRIDSCSIRTGYQAFFLSNEPTSSPNGPARLNKVFLSRIDMCGDPATFLFKAWPPRPGTLPVGEVVIGDDVWIDHPNPGMKVFPASNWIDWNGQPSKYGCFVEQDAQGQYVRFSTAADRVPSGPLAGQVCGEAGITGKIRVGKPGPWPFFAPTAGMGYI